MLSRVLEIAEEVRQRYEVAPESLPVVPNTRFVVEVRTDATGYAKLRGRAIIEKSPEGSTAVTGSAI